MEADLRPSAAKKIPGIVADRCLGRIVRPTVELGAEVSPVKIVLDDFGFP